MYATRSVPAIAAVSELVWAAAAFHRADSSLEAGVEFPYWSNSDALEAARSSRVSRLKRSIWTSALPRLTAAALSASAPYSSARASARSCRLSAPAWANATSAAISVVRTVAIGTNRAKRSCFWWCCSSSPAISSTRGISGPISGIGLHRDREEQDGADDGEHGARPGEQNLGRAGDDGREREQHQHADEDRPRSRSGGPLLSAASAPARAGTPARGRGAQDPRSRRRQARPPSCTDAPGM